MVEKPSSSFVARDPDATEAYSGALPSADACSAETLIGARIGPYRILRRIAEGGMGTVFLAEREDHFKQRVALKMIHPEKTSDAVLQRFYAERQILADLDHPYIARIFDGGATQGTLPFFVMEYVEGKPFDVACAGLTLRQRLVLFQKVCGAVHYAHRSLVVHRDLKPSNILVTVEGEPKLLDFGIAKLLDRGHDGRDSEARRSHPGPMTIAYASPEQLNGDPITIGTDIYSLGVLLYKILCGGHPHHQTELSAAGLMHAICYKAPVRPSQMAEPHVARRLRGDLDAMVLKTLNKCPEERYDSAAQLAEEIQLHLDDLPVRAWRGTWHGRLRKSARRNKLVLAAAILLLAFSSTVTLLWRHAVEQQTEAERARAQAEKTREFIIDFFEAVEPDRSPGPGIDLKKVLDSGRRSLEKSLQDEPQIRADLLGTLATIYHALALYDDALLLQEEAVKHRREMRPRDPRKLAVDLNNLAIIHYSLQEYDKAEKILRESLPQWNQLGDPYEVNALANLGAALIWQDKFHQALEAYDQALKRSAELSLESHADTATIHYGLGAAHKRLGDRAAAEHHLRLALSAYEQDPETRASRIAQVQSSLGGVLRTTGRPAEARPYLEEALATRRRLFGEHHPKTAGSQCKLAVLLLDMGEVESAEDLLKQAGDTYSMLQDEVGAAEVREAQDRLVEISGLRPSPVESSDAILLKAGGSF